MSGLGGLNKSANGVVIGLVQLQLPVVETPADLAAQTQRICELVGKARRNQRHDGPGRVPRVRAARPVDGHRRPRSCARSTGPRSRPSRQACVEQPDLGLLLDHGSQPRRQPVQQRPRSSTTSGEHPALLPQAASVGAGRAVGAGQPRHPGVRRAERQQARADHLPRRHVPRDGARVRVQGRRDHPAHGRLHGADPPRLAASPTRPTPSATWPTPRACACAAATAASTRWARACSATSTARCWSRAAAAPDEIITAELRPDLVREARTGWGVENNIYQLCHRGYVAVKGGAQDCPYTYMQDMAAGRYRLPWERRACR